MFKPNYAADILYPRVRGRGRWSQLWSILTRGSRRLFALNEINTSCRIDTRHAAGVQTVPISQIRGSEGRNNDFDRGFYPLQNHSKERWVSIATAWQQGKILPVVELIKVGDIYFVRDGHHRISVARALGLKEVEARVTVWRIEGAFTAPSPANIAKPETQPARDI